MITLLLLARATYINGVVLHAHHVRGESRNQRNTTGEVATIQQKELASFYNTIELFKVLCDIIKHIFTCSITSRSTQRIELTLTGATLSDFSLDIVVFRLI